jgi:hypothetical protein
MLTEMLQTDPRDGKVATSELENRTFEMGFPLDEELL